MGSHVSGYIPVRGTHTHTHIGRETQLQNVSSVTLLIKMFGWTSREKRNSLSVLTPCHYKSNCSEHRSPTVNVKGRGKVRGMSLYTVKEAICHCSASHYRGSSLQPQHSSIQEEEEEKISSITSYSPDNLYKAAMQYSSRPLLHFGSILRRQTGKYCQVFDLNQWFVQTANITTD